MAVTSAASAQFLSPPVPVNDTEAPVKVVSPQTLRMLGQQLTKRFDQYKSDRRVQEERWLRNLRQYLGLYDPEVESQLSPDRSRAYPKLTRVKCISMQARIIDLMFPSDDSNWTLMARPSADMDIADVKMALAAAIQRDTDANGQAPQVTDEYVQAAVHTLAEQRARDLTTEIEDQLQELGGDQTYSYVMLNVEVVAAAIVFGIGLLRGPYVREVKSASWVWDAKTQQPKTAEHSKYMPVFETLNIWDFYPDMSAKRLQASDGYFIRKVMSRAQLRKLADREDFFKEVIEDYLKMHEAGNYVAQEFETTLRAMGTAINVNIQKPQSYQFEVIIWHGYVDGKLLRDVGEDIADDKLTDQMEAEIWMLDGNIIKAQMDDWTRMGVEMQTLHHFIFDKDDTCVIGFGLPNVMRDSQMSVSSAARMMLDNASVVCGPITEMNTELLKLDQDLSGIGPWKTFYRDDTGPTAQYPAVREIKVNSHIQDLQSIIELFSKFADTETFVNAMTGGDMSKMPSEPMRNLAGASMLMGNASLPFKQIIRNYDQMTASVIQSLVHFNTHFNSDIVKVADYDVIPRGATSLIAKEVRGAQIDQLSSTLTPDEKLHVDERKLVEAKFRSRDLENMLVSYSEYLARKKSQDQQQSLQVQLTQEQLQATTRNLLAQAFKNMTQGNKNQSTASVETINAALQILEKGSDQEVQELIGRMGGASGQGGQVASSGAVPGATLPAGGQSGMVPGSGGDGTGNAGDTGAPNGMPAGGMPDASGGVPSAPQVPS